MPYRSPVLAAGAPSAMHHAQCCTATSPLLPNPGSPYVPSCLAYRIPGRRAPRYCGQPAPVPEPSRCSPPKPPAVRSASSQPCSPCCSTRVPPRASARKSAGTPASAGNSAIPLAAQPVTEPAPSQHRPPAGPLAPEHHSTGLRRQHRFQAVPRPGSRPPSCQKSAGRRIPSP